AVLAKDYPWQHRKSNAAERPLVTSASEVGRATPCAPYPSYGLGSLLGSRNIILLTLSYAAVGYFQYLFFYWMHYYFDQILHLGKTESRFYAGLPNLAMAVAMPLGGWLTDLAQRRLGHKRGQTLVPRVSMLASAGLLLLGIFAKDSFWIVLWFTL